LLVRGPEGIQNSYRPVIRMVIEKERGRALKRRVHQILTISEPDEQIRELSEIPAKKVVNVLFSKIQSTDENIKWSAVVAMGVFVSEIADQEMEWARVIMRRLMWNLNDESGGIGWGSPEAMGEIMACHGGLAEEYSNVFLSYTRLDGNYLEDEMLQRGLLWGIGRLCQVRPLIVQGSIHCLLPYLGSNDVHVRGLAAWILGMLDAPQEAAKGLERLMEEDREIRICIDRNFQKYRLKELAEKALRKH